MAKIQKDYIKKHSSKTKESKISSKGRSIIKPKKIQTTSSDEKQKRKKKLIKKKNTNISEALHDIRLSVPQRNIFKDITNSDNIHVPVVEHTLNEIHEQIERHTNIESICGADTNTPCSSKHSSKNDTNNTSKTYKKNESLYAAELHVTHNRKTDNNNVTREIFNMDEIPVVFAKVDQPDTATVEMSEPNQNEILQLLRQVIEQNFVIMADVKSLKRHHAIIQNDLYKRPDGFPLSTVEEFQELESDADRLNELQTYLQFVGGIKLREALSHFQKETMTDELTCKFTYWGRRGSLPFYNTQVAKVFFYVAKMCPNFKGPEDRTIFKLEIMEVFRTAKQRQYLRNKAMMNRDSSCSSSSQDDPDDVTEVSNTDISDESDIEAN